MARIVGRRSSPMKTRNRSPIKRHRPTIADYAAAAEQAGHMDHLPSLSNLVEIGYSKHEKGFGKAKLVTPYTTKAKHLPGLEKASESNLECESMKSLFPGKGLHSGRRSFHRDIATGKIRNGSEMVGSSMIISPSSLKSISNVDDASVSTIGGSISHPGHPIYEFNSLSSPSSTATSSVRHFKKGQTAIDAVAKAVAAEEEDMSVAMEAAAYRTLKSASNAMDPKTIKATVRCLEMDAHYSSNVQEVLNAIATVTEMRNEGQLQDDPVEGAVEDAYSFQEDFDPTIESYSQAIVRVTTAPIAGRRPIVTPQIDHIERAGHVREMSEIFHRNPPFEQRKEDIRSSVSTLRQLRESGTMTSFRNKIGRSCSLATGLQLPIKAYDSSLFFYGDDDDQSIRSNTSHSVRGMTRAQSAYSVLDSHANGRNLDLSSDLARETAAKLSKNPFLDTTKALHAPSHNTDPDLGQPKLLSSAGEARTKAATSFAPFLSRDNTLIQRPSVPFSSYSPAVTRLGSFYVGTNMDQVVPPDETKQQLPSYELLGTLSRPLSAVRPYSRGSGSRASIGFQTLNLPSEVLRIGLDGVPILNNEKQYDVDALSELSIAKHFGEDSVMNLRPSSGVPAFSPGAILAGSEETITFEQVENVVYQNSRRFGDMFDRKGIASDDKNQASSPSKTWQDVLSSESLQPHCGEVSTWSSVPLENFTANNSVIFPDAPNKEDDTIAPVKDVVTDTTNDSTYVEPVKMGDKVPTLPLEEVTPTVDLDVEAELLEGDHNPSRNRSISARVYRPMSAYDSFSGKLSIDIAKRSLLGTTSSAASPSPQHKSTHRIQLYDAASATLEDDKPKPKVPVVIGVDHSGRLEIHLRSEQPRPRPLSARAMHLAPVAPRTPSPPKYFDPLDFVIQRISPNEATAERDALMALYKSCHGDDWHSNHGWGSNAPVGTWKGITTNPQGYVVKISLVGNNLSGKFPESLDLMKHLEILILDENYLSGELPDYAINLCKKLRMLSLRKNRLSGDLPFSLLTSLRDTLEEVWLSDNCFTGSIQDGISDLQSLTHLCLSGNYLTGRLPPALGRVYGLKYLCLSCNQLEGGIPSQWVALQSLESLSLHNNNLSGHVPDFLSSMFALKNVSLFSNPNLIDGDLYGMDSSILTRTVRSS